VGITPSNKLSYQRNKCWTSSPKRMDFFTKTKMDMEQLFPPYIVACSYLDLMGYY